MRLIFIRHAEPDYENHTLTEKGFREAELLSKRVATWTDIRCIYVSPLPRAQLTAAPCLAALGRTAETLPWLREFWPLIENPTTGEMTGATDLMPDYYTRRPAFYDRRAWLSDPIYADYPDVSRVIRETYDGIDGILAENGYRRDGEMYRLDPALTDGDDEAAILFFCHGLISSIMLSYLTGIPPVIFTRSFQMPPTGITVVNAEKRFGDGAHFRIQTFGDTSHLTENGEPVSASGFFSTVFQE